MKAKLSPKEIATALGVSESSLKRWCDDGRIRTSRTVGGHRRIPIQEAIRFARESSMPILRPDVLGVPELGRFRTTESDAERESVDRSAQLLDLLKTGRPEDVRAMVLDLYLGGESVAAICDGPIKTAMHHLGEIWAHDKAGVYIEHRATDMCIHALNMLRSAITIDEAGSPPVALGGAPADDPYILPSLMASCVLADLGYHDMNFGPHTPATSIIHAAERYRPRLVWLSVSTPEGAKSLGNDIGRLVGQLGSIGARLVVGGRASREVARRSDVAVHMCDTMAELAGFARALKS